MARMSNIINTETTCICGDMKHMKCKIKTSLERLVPRTRVKPCSPKVKLHS